MLLDDAMPSVKAVGKTVCTGLLVSALSATFLFPSKMGAPTGGDSMMWHGWNVAGAVLGVILLCLVRWWNDTQLEKSANLIKGTKNLSTWRALFGLVGLLVLVGVLAGMFTFPYYSATKVGESNIPSGYTLTPNTALDKNNKPMPYNAPGFVMWISFLGIAVTGGDLFIAFMMSREGGKFKWNFFVQALMSNLFLFIGGAMFLSSCAYDHYSAHLLGMLFLVLGIAHSAEHLHVPASQTLKSKVTAVSSNKADGFRM